MLARCLFLLMLCAALSSAGAQSLRGSRASVQRMYDGARAERLKFYTTPAAVRAAAQTRKLVRLSSDENLRLDDDVRYPYVRATTRTFVVRLAAQYRSACGEQIVVTSGVRPSSRQPANSSPRSVHPTGMAVDVRKPDGRCLKWLRRSLLDLEEQGVIEATEEHDPAHFHVAVFPSSYRRYLAARSQPAAARVASD